MRKTDLIKLTVLMASFSMTNGCGGHEPEVEVADSCKVQVTEDDCLLIGNNLLAFTKGFENFECKWKDGSCTMHAK